MRAVRADLVRAGCGLALLVFMFGFAWYEVDELPGQRSAHGAVWTQNGWHALTGVRWLMLLTALATLAAPALRARGTELRRRFRLDHVILGLAIVTALWLVIRVLIDLPSPPSVPDQKLGALLGLASALGIVLGAWEALLAGRQGQVAPSRRARVRVGA